MRDVKVLDITSVHEHFEAHFNIVRECFHFISFFIYSLFIYIVSRYFFLDLSIFNHVIYLVEDIPTWVFIYTFIDNQHQIMSHKSLVPRKIDLKRFLCQKNVNSTRVRLLFFESPISVQNQSIMNVLSSGHSLLYSGNSLIFDVCQ